MKIRKRNVRYNLRLNRLDKGIKYITLINVSKDCDPKAWIRNSRDSNSAMASRREAVVRGSDSAATGFTVRDAQQCSTTTDVAKDFRSSSID